MELLGIDFGCAYGSLSNGQLPDKDCLLHLLSKLLGYFLIAASTTVKLPQILKILRNKSISGLSVVAFELEVVGYTIGLAYCIHKGLPFSAYGEFAFLLIQAVILVSIIYYYSQPVGLKTWMKVLIYGALAPTILAGQIDPVLFEALYASKHAIFILARVPQIWKNFKNKSTGQLSFFNIFNEFRRLHGKGFYQHSGKSSNKCSLGLSYSHRNKRYPPQSNIDLSEANCKEREEDKVGCWTRIMVVLFQFKSQLFTSDEPGLLNHLCTRGI